MSTSLEQVRKADALMNDDLMRADPKALSLESAGGGYVILKALEKVVKQRLDDFKSVLKKQIKAGTKYETDLFYINHVQVQRKPTLSFERVRALQKKHDLPVDAVFLVPEPPPLDKREVDLDFLRENVPEEELNACYEDSGYSTQVRQGARGELKRRLAEVVR